MEIYIKQEYNPSQVEITEKDISEDWSDANDEDEFKIPINNIGKFSSFKQECDKTKEESENNDCIKIKTEPLDSRYYEDESNLRHCDWVETESVDIKADVKKEIGTNLENLESDNTYYNTYNNTWTNGQNNDELEEYTVDVKQETDRFSELSDSSDYFTESCVKSEERTLKGSDSQGVPFSQKLNFVTEKEQDVENVGVKSEASDTAVKEVNDSNKPIYKCNTCNFKTFHKRKLELHLELHEDPTKLSWYKCSECNYKTRQKGHLNRHLLVHQNIEEREMFICGECDYKFKQKCTLRRHIKDVHIASRIKKEDLQIYDQIYHCNDCSYSTSRRSLFVSHLDKHKNVQDITGLYICETCSFSTKYKRNLRAHVLTHKQCPELQVYVCNLCKFKSKSGYSLKRHNLSKGHLKKAGKMHEYCPRFLKLKQEKSLY